MRALYPGASKSEVLAALPGRSWDAIRTRASMLGIRRVVPTAPRLPSPETVHAEQARFRAKHGERIKRANKTYRLRNREREVARKRAWREANLEKANHATTAWRVANPEKVRAIGVNIRARRRALFGAVVLDFTVEQWDEMKAMHEYRCAYCHEEKPLTQDHIIPISKGGAHTRDNIAPACRSCNSSKHNRDLLEWLARTCA